MTQLQPWQDCVHGKMPWLHMITTVLLAQLMLYLVLCVRDIVAMAGACQRIIPAAIFGLLWTFLLTTYVWQ